MAKNLIEAAAAEEVEEKVEKTIDLGKARRQFALWHVGDRDIKLKLMTSTTCELERKYGCNLLSIMGEGDGGMPAITVMLDIVYAAAKDWNHGLKKSTITDLYDEWLAEGGSMIQFYTDIYMDIFLVSGFFSEAQAAQMREMKDDLEA